MVGPIFFVGQTIFIGIKRRIRRHLIAKIKLIYIFLFVEITTMPYTNFLQFETVQYLELLDNIPYKYIKNMINEDAYEVEITDLECDRVAYCKTRFILTLSQYISQGTYSYSTFSIVKEYNNKSYIASLLLYLYEDDSDEEE